MQKIVSVRLIFRLYGFIVSGEGGHHTHNKNSLVRGSNTGRDTRNRQSWGSNERIFLIKIRFLLVNEKN
ncbi:hypothetical protein [Alkalibaculum bacchi]|uniref:hypothetical protein n=1 Tax=Alkalibaculum bacchi TaxID=645887 RepID=UPI0011BF23C7|nr:hypothetical protein [Alkalibaculum bacchi]